MSLSIVLSVVLLWRGKQKRKSLSLPSVNNQFPKVSYNDLARATDGFSTSKLIGKGRYSSVYQGELFPDRIVVAVKVFSLDTRGAQKSFIAECNALRNVRHRNLVPILTACSSIDSRGNDFKALVYKFMQRGDLHALLYLTRGDANTSTPSCITLAQRLNIVTDVADALEYLHHNNQGTIVHCDLKPSNILLDDNMTAHIGDFGLARFKVGSGTPYSGDSVSTSSVAIKGTIGYIAPGNSYLHTTQLVSCTVIFELNNSICNLQSAQEEAKFRVLETFTALELFCLRYLYGRGLLTMCSKMGSILQDSLR
jgi:serine/threonine protein kinase